MPALTGLRFFAAAMVVLHHFGPSFLQPGIVLRAARAGYVGVSLFFFLSGFVLAHTYQPGERAVHAQKFLLARLARIYPLFLFALLISAPSFVMVSRGHSAPWWMLRILPRVLLIHDWIGLIGAWNVPDWSLSAEWAFYLSFPWVAPFMARTKWYVVALFAGLGLGVAFLAHAANPVFVSPEGQPLSRLSGFVAYHPVFRFHEFAVGIFCGAQWTKLPALQAVARRLWLFPIAMVVLCVLSAAPLALPFLPFGNGLLLPIWIVIVLSLTGTRGLCVRFLSQRWVVLLGEASFALYLLHIPLWGIFAFVARTPRGPLEFGGFFLVLTAISIATFRWVEVPLRGWIRGASRTSP